MAIPKVLFRDGYDVYVDDLEFIQDTVETEVQERMKHVTLSGGVATGLAASAITDAVEITAGDAYDEQDRALIQLAGLDTIAVGAGDNNKYVVIENVAADSVSDTHPVLLTAAFRRRLLTATLSLTASPSTRERSRRF